MGMVELLFGNWNVSFDRKEEKINFETLRDFTKYHLEEVLKGNFDPIKGGVIVTPNIENEPEWFCAINDLDYDSYILSKKNSEVIVFNPLRYGNFAVVDKINNLSKYHYGTILSRGNDHRNLYKKIIPTNLKYEDIKNHLAFGRSILDM